LSSVDSSFAALRPRVVSLEHRAARIEMLVKVLRESRPRW
jgi:hypothetical protein